MPVEAGLNQKQRRLRALLSSMESVLVSFSGGVDSTLLLQTAAEILPGRTTALTAKSALNPPGEMDLAASLARQMGVRHLVVDFEPLEIDAVRENAVDRCYRCKTALADLLTDHARRVGASHVVEGSNADDATAHRPGSRALIEAGIRSPLREAGLTKTDIRTLCRERGLPNWDRPAQACLATRFPYGAHLTRESLFQVHEAERLLTEWGVPGVRARHHGPILRLEPPLDLMPRLLDDAVRSRLVRRLTDLGFEFVTVDMAGYRSGVFDHPHTASEPDE